MGLVLDRGAPVLLAPGQHQWDNSNRLYKEAFDLSQPLVSIPPYTLLLVRDGQVRLWCRRLLCTVRHVLQVAITHDNGRLDMRTAGYHVLTHERHIFSCFLDVTDQFDVSLACE